MGKATIFYIFIIAASGGLELMGAGWEGHICDVPDCSDPLLAILGIGKVARRAYARLEDNTASFEAHVERSIEAFNGLAFRNGGRSLIGWLKPVIRGVVADDYGNGFRVICSFSFFIYRLYRAAGVVFVVKYMKAAQVLLMQAAGSHRIADSGLLGVRVKRSRRGLPLVIPAMHREKIRRGDDRVIRAGLTLFGIYRILSFKGSLKLGTITDPLKGSYGPLEESLRDFIDVFWTELRRFFSFEKFCAILSEQIKYFPILTSNPITSRLVVRGEAVEGYISTSWPSIVLSAKAGFDGTNGEARKALMEYALRRGYTPFWQRLDELRKRDLPFRLSKSWPPYLGKLGLKEEPAGKVRVFAMVDPWTQWVFYPLHRAIQLVLRSIETDGTFDQKAPAVRLMGRVLASNRKPKLYSFDLSAATDRLPVRIQVGLLYPVLGEAAGAWARALVEREYQIRSTAYKVDTKLKYSVGQPMGALSSGVLLALTHHLIVQYCWGEVCRKNGRKYGGFSEYAVLGDDIVIADPKVAERYLVLMSRLGVEIGLAKSLITRGKLPVMEFAKRYGVGDRDASMVPFRDTIVAKLSTAVSSEFMSKHRFGLNAYLALRGKGFKARGSVTGNLWAISNRLRVILVYLSYPGHVLGKPHLSDWLTMKSLISYGSRDAVPWPKLYEYLGEFWKRDYIKKVRAVEKAVEDAVSAKPLEESFDELILSNEPGVRGNWSEGRWQGPWKEFFPSWFTGKVVKPMGGYVASVGTYKFIRPAKGYEGWTPRLSVGYSLSGHRTWFYLDRKGLWQANQDVRPRQEEMIGPFRRPIIYSLLEDEQFMEGEARLGAVGQFKSQHSEVVMPQGITADEYWDKYYSMAKDRDLPIYGVMRFSHLGELMHRVDKEAIAPRATWEVQERAEEKSFSSFLPLYNRWAALQRIIQKANPVKRVESLALIPGKPVREKAKMELLPSIVTKGSVSDFFDHNRGPHQRSSGWWAGRKVLLNFMAGLALGGVAVGLILFGSSMEAGNAARGLETATSEGEPRPRLSVGDYTPAESSDIRGIPILMGFSLVILMAGCWGYLGGGGDDSARTVVYEAAQVDPALIPLRLPGEVGNVNVESRLIRLSGSRRWGNPSPETGPSPIMAHGYWE